MSLEEVVQLRLRAQRLRRYARDATDPLIAANFHSTALDLEMKALKLETSLKALPETAMDAPTGEPDTGPEAAAAMKPAPDSDVEG